jgi:hypothetical protein
MSSATAGLRDLFEKAHEVRERICEGANSTLAALNSEAVAKQLVGRLVVISVPEDHLSEAYKGKRHSHLLPSGRLGGFAMKHCEERDEPELVTVLHDVRGTLGNTLLTPLTDVQTPHDVEDEQMDCGVLRDVRQFVVDPNFSFPDLAKLCRRATDGNLGLALFATALNDMYLPYNLASAIYTLPAQVHYFTNGKDVGPAELGFVRYALDGSDIFSIMSSRDTEKPSLHVTNMFPEHPMLDFRDILIDHDVVGHDLP